MSVLISSESNEKLCCGCILFNVVAIHDFISLWHKFSSIQGMTDYE